MNLCRNPFTPATIALLLLFAHPSAVEAAEVTVIDAEGRPLPRVMVTQTLAEPAEPDVSDNGYAQPGRPFRADPQHTAFTNDDGAVVLPDRAGATRLRLRKPGYLDVEMQADVGASVRVVMEPETDRVALAAAKPSNIWLGALDLGSPEAKKHFKMQCGFCHQFGSPPTRLERTPEEWKEVIDRMVRYGSRLPTDLQKKLPEILPAEWKRIAADPGVLAEQPEWRNVENLRITEWPLGDQFSQMHDMIVGHDGRVWIADNIQDRLYAIDTTKNAVTVYKIPHREGEPNGGMLAGRVADFPRHDSTSNAHSLAQSKVDGHIFITPSAQQRLVEFDPHTETFTLHDIDEGFYPHTIRIAPDDDVWFTLALSNQVARFDRDTQTFRLYDLPARSTKEKLLTKYMHVVFKLINWGIPLPNMLAIDWDATGTPMPYGIDIAPDGTVWFARLHAKDIGKIDPRTHEVSLIETPFLGPRRLRIDAQGNPWIVSYGESLLAKYDPAAGKFTTYPLPVTPEGSETPYALGVDNARGIVWVNGNQSDSVYGLDMTRETWRHIPLPRRRTFTRDIDVAEDGSLYTSNSSFPSWHIEGAQPTLIRIEP